MQRAVFTRLGRRAIESPILSTLAWLWVVGPLAAGSLLAATAASPHALESLTRQGRYPEALAVAREELREAEARFGRQHTNVASALVDLARLLQTTGDRAGAEPLFLEALQIRETALGPDHPSVAQGLDELGALCRLNEEFARAEALHQRALAINVQKLGPDHKDTVGTWFNLAMLYQKQGDYPKAETNLVRAVGQADRAFGPEDPTTAEILRSLGLLFISMGRYADAESPLVRALTILETAFGADHPATTTSRSNLALLRKKTGRYLEAEQLYQRALAAQEGALGTNSPTLTPVLNNLGLLYTELGRYRDAEQCLQRALELKQHTLPPGHSSLGLAFGNLGHLYHQMGDLARAEVMYRRDLEITEKALGPDHPETLTSLNNLAAISRELRNFGKAEALLRRVTNARAKQLGPDHPDLANALNNLAEIYHQMGRIEAATALSERALSIRRARFGTTHPSVAQSLNNLAMLYADQHDLARAESTAREALELREQAFGTEHPEVANSLNSLAQLCLQMNESQRAEPLARRALAINTRHLGASHPETVDSMSRLIQARFDAADLDEARRLTLDIQAAREIQLAGILGFASEADRLTYLERSDPYSWPGTLGLTDALARSTLHTKGVVLDSLIEDRRVSAASPDPAVRDRVRQLMAARRRWASLDTTGKPEFGRSSPAAPTAERQTLMAEIERLESDLARRVTSLGRARRALSVTPQAVQAALPKTAVLLEFVRYRHYLTTNRSEPRYGVVILPAQGDAEWVPLGPAKPIDQAVRLYRHLMRIPSDDASVESHLTHLHRILWTPLTPRLPPDTRVLLISPDAELNFISFATLLTPAGRFLAQDYLIHYVGSGRDLVEPPPRPSSRRTLSVWANPDFAEADSPADPGHEPPPPPPAVMAFDRGTVFAPLPGAEREARSLVTRAEALGFASADLFVGPQATETAFNRMPAPSPSVLHMATHGFFWGWSGPGRAPDDGLGVDVAHQDLPPLETWPAIRDPMRASGVALAGAARTIAAWARADPPPAEDDGLVTAEEIGCLALDATSLVVLAACESGIGELTGSEGVLGLRRSFALAGARHLLLTLWPIPDAETVPLILDFYQQWAQRDNAPRALAEVQRQALQTLREQRGTAAAARTAGPFILTLQGSETLE